MFTSDSIGGSSPASNNNTLCFSFSLKRAATTDPAEPAPITTKSYSSIPVHFRNIQTNINWLRNSYLIEFTFTTHHSEGHADHNPLAIDRMPICCIEQPELFARERQTIDLLDPNSARHTALARNPSIFPSVFGSTKSHSSRILWLLLNSIAISLNVRTAHSIVKLMLILFLHSPLVVELMSKSTQSMNYSILNTRWNV